MQTKQFQGETDCQRNHFTPYLMVAHIVAVDLLSLEVSFMVTSGDHAVEFLLDGRTNSSFERINGVQIDIMTLLLRL
jgi:hypothetical protein